MVSNTSISRRSLLKRGGGAVIMGTLAFASGPVALLAPSRTWALEVKTMTEHQGKTLMAFTRHLYPHKTLEDAVYALVVKDLDGAAQKDPAVSEVISRGVARLDDIGGGNWLKRKPTLQAIDVESMEKTPFFEKVRSTAVVSLYSNKMAWAHFGYGGPVWDQDGYLSHGFNDLHWLPDPPADASGPVPDAAKA